ncbi:MAG: hypothetical protein ABIP39_04190 [Polyangiaceae bacterium]
MRFERGLVFACFALGACSSVLAIEDPSDGHDAGLDAEVDSSVLPDSATTDTVASDAGSDGPVDLGIFCGDAAYCNQATEVCSLTFCAGPVGIQKCVPRGVMNDCAQVKCTDNLDCQSGSLCCTNYGGADGSVPLDTITGASCIATTACPSIQMCNPSHLECPAGSTCLSTKPDGYYSCQ